MFQLDQQRVYVQGIKTTGSGSTSLNGVKMCTLQISLEIPDIQLAKIPDYIRGLICAAQAITEGKEDDEKRSIKTEMTLKWPRMQYCITDVEGEVGVIFNADVDTKPDIKTVGSKTFLHFKIKAVLPTSDADILVSYDRREDQIWLTTTFGMDGQEDVEDRVGPKKRESTPQLDLVTEDDGSSASVGGYRQ